jgi:hypothetical protein
MPPRARAVTSPSPSRPSPGVAKAKEAQHRALFNQLDTDKSGYLDASEIQAALIEMNGGANAALTGAQVQMMIAEADTDDDGQVDFDEFCKVLAISKKWQAVESSYMDTVFNVVDGFAKPVQQAVRDNTVVNVVHAVSGDLLSCPSFFSRCAASAVGTFVLILTGFGLLGILPLVAMAKSRGHLGHWLFGYCVVSRTRSHRHCLALLRYRSLPLARLPRSRTPHILTPPLLSRDPSQARTPSLSALSASSFAT